MSAVIQVFLSISADFGSQIHLLRWMSENAEWELTVLCLTHHCGAVLICLFFSPYIITIGFYLPNVKCRSLGL